MLILVHANLNRSQVGPFLAVNNIICTPHRAIAQLALAGSFLWLKAVEGLGAKAKEEQ